jgi:hypothetical protein
LSGVFRSSFRTSFVVFGGGRGYKDGSPFSEVGVVGDVTKLEQPSKLHLRDRPTVLGGLGGNILFFSSLFCRLNVELLDDRDMSNQISCPGTGRVLRGSVGAEDCGYS